jgi:hypothetical protein
LAASEWRHREGLDTPVLDSGRQVLETGDNVTEPRYGPPVILGWEVEDPRPHELLPEVGLAELDLTSPAAGDVVLVHLWEPLLEAEGDSLAHDTHGVHRVRKCLGVRFEDVSLPDANDHDVPPGSRGIG